MRTQIRRLVSYSIFYGCMIALIVITKFWSLGRGEVLLGTAPEWVKRE